MGPAKHSVYYKSRQKQVLFKADSAQLTHLLVLEQVRRPAVQAHKKAKSRGCLPLKKDNDGTDLSGPSFRTNSAVSFKAKPMEIEQSNDTVKEVCFESLEQFGTELRRLHADTHIVLPASSNLSFHIARSVSFS